MESPVEYARRQKKLERIRRFIKSKQLDPHQVIIDGIDEIEKNEIKYPIIDMFYRGSTT